MSAFSMIQDDGSTVAFTYSPQQNLQPTGAGTVATPLFNCQSITGAAATTAINNDARVVVVTTTTAAETVTLPDPRAAAANLSNGFVIYIVNVRVGGGNAVTVQTNGGGNPVNSGAYTIAAPGALPLQNGRTFMVVDSSAQGGWAVVTV